MVLTARGEAAWITRGEMARTARGETRDGGRRSRSNGQQLCGRGPRPPGCDFDFGPVGFRSRAGANSLGVSWVGREAMAISFVVSYLSAMALSIV